MVFKPGDSAPQLSVDELLDLAGFPDGLDSRNSGVIPSARAVPNEQPPLRTTGAVLTLSLTYKAHISGGRAEGGGR